MKSSILILKSFLIVSILFLISLSSFGSHLAGGEMRYDYVGPDPQTSGNYLYKIRVLAYRYCGSGNTATYGCPVNQPEEVYLECGTTGAKIGPVRLSAKTYVPTPGERPNPRGAKDISSICSRKQSGCETRGGVNGYEAFFWEGNISVPRCGNWRVTYKSCTCCRNGVGNFTGLGNTGLELFINTNWSPGGSSGAPPANSGPVYYHEDQPFPSVCVGQKVSFAAGAYDKDGDSLFYEMTCPWATSGVGGRPVLTPMIVRGTGISCASPIPGFVLDSLTGFMTFTPTTTGSYIAAYYVYEYEACTGIIKGKTYREVQFQVATCINKPPLANRRIGNLTGNAFINNKDEIEVCEGQLISWDDTLSDPDLNDTLYLTSNVSTILPGVSMNVISTGKKNSSIARFTWRAKAGSQLRKQYFLRLSDDKCDIPGIADHLFKVKVNIGVSAGPDLNVCLGDTAKIRIADGYNYRWVSISGDPIVAGVNWFSQNTSNNAINFVPTKTTYVEVTGSIKPGFCGASSACNFKDTLVIRSAQNFTAQITSDTLVCNGSAVTLNAKFSQASLKYTHSWSPSNLFVDPSKQNPTLLPLKDDAVVYFKATSDSGCIRYDSVQVSVTNPFPHDLFATASDTVICLYDTIDLGVDYGKVNYGACGEKNKNCLGSNARKVLGNGAFRNVSGQNNIPAIYKSTNRTVKTQILYKAADLKSRGISAGPISSLAFEIAQLGSQGANPFVGFTIKMGCTNDVQLSSVFVQQLKTVFTPKQIIPVLGWNRHVFEDEYIWDGISNLIVEICWDNGANLYAADHLMTFDAVSYLASNHFYSSTSNGACSVAQGIGSPMSIVPKTEFGVCEGVNDANFTFQWSPIPKTSNPGFMSSNRVKDVRVSANLTTAKQYQLLVTDTSGVCSKTVTRNISVVSKYNTKPDSLPLQCVKGGIIQLTAPTPHTASNPGGKWTGLGIINDSLGYWDPAVSGAGRFPVTYGVTGDACASSGFTIINIADLPDPSLLGPIKACSMYGNKLGHELIPKVPGGYFSGTGVDSVSGVPTKYYVDGTKFNPTSLVPDTAFVRYKVFKGCWNDTIIKIPVVAPWDSTFTGVLSNGTPIFTKEFCSTASPDTLSVAGINPVWKITGSVQNRAAITDSVLGIFDPKLINNGAGGQVNIQVENKGFCGTKGIYRLNVNMPPEVKILAENFCFIEPGDCIASKIPASERKTLIKVRVAKYPNRLIDDNDPSTYVDVITADKAQTGWPNLIESDKVTKWDGRPWMIFPYKFEYPFCQLPKGRHSIQYQLAVKHRNNFADSDSLCYSTIDTAIHISDEIDVNLTADGDLCTKTSVIMKTGVTGSKYSYKWSDGSKNNSLTASAAGTYTVTVTSPTCVSEDSITLSYCISLEELKTPFSASLYPNPACDIIRLEINEMEEQIMLSIFSLNGQLVDEFNFEAINGKLEAEINVSQLPAGVYSFRVGKANEINTYRVVIE